MTREHLRQPERTAPCHKLLTSQLKAWYFTQDHTLQSVSDERSRRLALGHPVSRNFTQT